MTTIIEGADATGKTTFARKLAGRLGAGYLHAEAPTEKRWQDEYLMPLQRGSRKVLDRWHVGELVWPTLFGRPSLFSGEQAFRICNQALHLLGVEEVLIVVRDEDGIRRTLAERGEEDQADLVIESQRLFIEAAHKINHLPVRIVHSDLLHMKG